MKRLFLGVLPGAELLLKLQDIQKQLGAQKQFQAIADRCRWQSQDKLHSTIHFIGEVTDAEAKSLVERLESVSLPPRFSVTLSEWILLPCPRRANVLTVGKATGSREIERLSERVTGVCDLGPHKSRSLILHLTLARFRGPVSVDVSQLPVLSGLLLSVESLVLMESRLSPHGSPYEMIKEFPLAPLTLP